MKCPFQELFVPRRIHRIMDVIGKGGRGEGGFPDRRHAGSEKRLSKRVQDWNEWKQIMKKEAPMYE